MLEEIRERLEEIGRRLEQERTGRGLKQVPVSRYLGITDRTYINYEGGSTEMGVIPLTGLASLGLDVLYILTGERSYCATLDDEKDLLTRYRRLNPAERARVLNMMSQMQEPQGETSIYGAVGQYVVGNAQYVAGDMRAPFMMNVGNAEKKTKD